MPNYMPSKAVKTINNFLQILAKLKQDANLNVELESNLPELEQILTQTDDNSLELALSIKEWCQRHQLDLPKLKTRLEIGEDDDQDDSLEGERVDCAANKAMIIKAVQTSQSNQQPE